MFPLFAKVYYNLFHLLRCFKKRSPDGVTFVHDCREYVFSDSRVISYYYYYVVLILCCLIRQPCSVSLKMNYYLPLLSKDVCL